MFIGTMLDYMFTVIVINNSTNKQVKLNTVFWMNYC